MRRRDLSDDELNQVIKRRQSGSNWSKIQRETGIGRRKAKHAYDKWKQSHPLEEIKEARKAVAAAAFSQHMNSLVALAGSFTNYLSVLSLSDMEKNSVQFYSWLWQQDLLGESVIVLSQESSGGNIPYYQRQQMTMKEIQSRIRRNKLLFESLKIHTREKVSWNKLDQWATARDNSCKDLCKLRKVAIELISNFLKLEEDTKLLPNIKEGSGEDPVKRMTELVLEVIWQGILEDSLNQERYLAPQLHTEESSQHTLLKVGDEVFFSFNDNSTVGKVTEICNRSIDNLCRGKEMDFAKSLQGEVRIMKKVTEELREMLNSLKLIPMILATRCDLCPA